MRVFQTNENGLTYVSEKTPKSDNLILKVTKDVVIGAVCVVAMVVAGGWAVFGIGFLAFMALTVKFMR